jgi:hypothetical protein
MLTFLASADFDSLGGFLFPLVIIAMSMSIPIVAIITEHLQKKERMRLMEKAIEHGADLTNINFDEPAPQPRMPYRSGMVVLAVGIALTVGDRFLDASFGNLHFPLMVGGLITGLVGIAQLLNDWLNRDRLGK